MRDFAASCKERAPRGTLAQLGPCVSSCPSPSPEPLTLLPGRCPLQIQTEGLLDPAHPGRPSGWATLSVLHFKGRAVCAWPRAAPKVEGEWLVPSTVIAGCEI